MEDSYLDSELNQKRSYSCLKVFLDLQCFFVGQIGCIPQLYNSKDQFIKFNFVLLVQHQSNRFQQNSLYNYSNLALLQMLKNIFKNQNFQQIKILGQGTYGKCYLVNNTLENQLYVLKKIQIGGMNPQQIGQTMKQVRILQALDHPNIIKCIQAYIENSTLNIFMDYADGGDLSKKIKNAKGCFFSENQILNWFTQISLAIKHVHDRKIIHRDIKSQNIFLTNQNIVKLGDFGIAKPLQMTLQKNRTVVGTPYYMSPQICENKEYSLKTDIWSLGVILFEMCALKPPFDANSLPALALKISRGQYGMIPSHYSKQLKKLISDLLQVDPTKRPNINQMFQYTILKNRIDKFLPQGIRERQFSHTTLHSQNIFQREDLRKQIQKVAFQQPHLSSIISPRNANNQPLFFPSQIPQTKSNSNLKQKDSNSGLKEKNPFDKKKKPELRKRQISEPSLTPKNNQRRVTSNKSLTNLDKKKSEKQKSNFFKKKKLPQDYQNELSEIKQFRDCVVEMHEHLSSDRQREDLRKQLPHKLVNNFIKEEEQIQEDEESYTESETSETDSAIKETSIRKKSNQLSSTLEKILIELLGQKQLSKNYFKIQENAGFILGQQKSDQNHFQNQGLVSLLYGLNNLLAL